MSAAARPLVTRSLFGRLTFLVAAIALAAMLAVVLAAELTLRSARDDALAAAVDTDLAGLADIYATGGREELLARIDDRLALVPEGQDRPHYLLADASGQRIGGDIARWPALAAETSESGYVRLPDGTRSYARATLLSSGLRLIVAREYGGWQALLARVRGALLLVGALIAAAMVAAGSWAARRLRRRVAGINEAYQAVEHGALDRRAPGAERADELGELARHANRMLARIEALVGAHRDMSDHVAHELRTPLMHLDNRLLHLVDRAADPEAVALLGSAREDIRAVVRMLDSLLDISASEARRGDLAGLSEIDLSATIGNLADLYEESAADKSILFDVAIEEGVALVGDPMQLSRMVSNLLDNAFKIVPAGSGIVRLVVAAGPRIEVSDNGPGIPADMRERVFERFRRLPAAGCKGHGLGLALARAVAERHGLSIRIEDAAPGARFVIEPEQQG